MKQNLPNDILLALATYYINRNKSNRWSVGGMTSSLDKRTITIVEKTNVTWDKVADLLNISNTCKKRGYTLQACAGTFWIGKGKKTFQMDENSFPNVTTVKYGGQK